VQQRQQHQHQQHAQLFVPPDGWIPAPVRLEFDNVTVSINMPKQQKSNSSGSGSGNSCSYPGKRVCSMLCSRSQYLSSKLCNAQWQRREVLSHASGVAEPGELVAIIGSSGSGKTTLLNVLTGRLESSKHIDVSGSIKLNGQLVDAKFMRTSGICGYITQQDVVLGTLTPRESIHFAAKLRLPASMSAHAKRRRTEVILNQLELRGCADTRAGSLLLKGISGGERKRTSIGVELVTDPILLACDEPTSGLDSALALTTVQHLKNLTRSGRSVLITVHAPSSKMFRLFDKLAVMSDGKLAYWGPARQAHAFFARHSSAKMSMLVNPSEFCLDVLNAPQAVDTSKSRAVRKQEQAAARVKVDAIFAAFARQPVRLDARYDRLPRIVDAATLELLPIVRSNAALGGAGGPTPPGFDAAAAAAEPEDVESDKIAWLTQLRILTHRTWLNYVREPVNTIVRVLENVFLSIFVGLLYVNADTNQQGFISRVGFCFFLLSIQSFISVVSSVLTFSEERAVFYRERLQGAYSVSAYFVSKTIIEVPMQFLLALLFTLPGYWMVGLQSDAVLTMKFCFIMFLLGLAGASLGLVIGAAIRHPIVALLMSTIAVVPHLSVSGFFVNVESLNALLWVLKVTSPMRYAFENLLIVEFQHLRFTCTDDESFITRDANGDASTFCPVTHGEEIIHWFGFSTDTFWSNTFVLMALCIGFRTLAFLVL
jgi:ABC-type multidrug transport system ATPase subunit